MSTSTAPSLPRPCRRIADDSGARAVTWVVIAYTLAMVATMPMYGKLSDLDGRDADAAWPHDLRGRLDDVARDAEPAADSGSSRLDVGGLGVRALATVADIVPLRKLGAGWRPGPDLRRRQRRRSRSPAACSSNTSAGGGRSSSTCRLGCWRRSSSTNCTSLRRIPHAIDWPGRCCSSRRSPASCCWRRSAA